MGLKQNYYFIKGYVFYHIRETCTVMDQEDLNRLVSEVRVPKAWSENDGFYYDSTLFEHLQRTLSDITADKYALTSLRLISEDDNIVYRYTVTRRPVHNSIPKTT